VVTGKLPGGVGAHTPSAYRASPPSPPPSAITPRPVQPTRSELAGRETAGRPTGVCVWSIAVSYRASVTSSVGTVGSVAAVLSAPPGTTRSRARRERADAVGPTT